MRVFQHVDEFKQRDGIGNDIIGMDKILRELQIESYIVCRRKMQGVSIDNVIQLDLKEKYRPKDVHILHYGGHAYPIQAFNEFNGKKILRFHNITPSHFFEPFVPKELYNLIQLNELKSKFELTSLALKVDSCLFDSNFNKDTFFELTSPNKKKLNKSLVVPIFRKYPKINNINLTPNYKIGFVARIVPNKKIEDLIFLTFYLKKIHSNYRLTLVGKPVDAFRQYYFYIQNLIKDLDLESNVEIFHDLEDLGVVQKIEEMDFFVSMSEHEGFGIPLVESLALGTPVIAYQIPAIHETLKNSGILFSQKDYRYIAELIDYLNSKIELKKKIIEIQNESMKYYREYPFLETIKGELNIN